MATFFRGAGVDTYWHRNDARLRGFAPHDGSASFTLDRLMAHIKNGTTFSPFVSLTSSYGVALDYALYAGRNPPTPSIPAYVYEVEFSSVPQRVALINPVWEVVAATSDPLSALRYHHDGQQIFLLGVVAPTRMAAHLARQVVHPPPSGATPRQANLSVELETLIRALRDAEILVYGTVPRDCIKSRHEVY